MLTIKEKIFILNKSRKIFKNWINIIPVYFNLNFDKFTILKTRNDFKIKIRNYSTDLMALINVWVVEEYNKKHLRVNSNDIVIDIGAHIGLFSLYVSQFCKEGEIYAYEPIKTNFELLIDNIKINSLKQIKVYNLAVLDSKKKIEIFLNDDDAGHSLYTKSQNSVVVESTSLQHIFDENQIQCCNLLKMDCEGAEYEILKNLPLEYFKRIDKIIMEYHMFDKFPEKLEEVKTILVSQNFKIKTNSTTPDMGILYASKNN